MNSVIENLNYYNDRRTQAAPDLSDHPTTWAICDVCQGDGKTVNPSIDAGGLSAEDFYDDPDFAEDYFSGVHDVSCGHCGGSGKVKIIDRSRMSDEALEEYDADLEAEAEIRAIERAEMMMGA